MEITAVPIIADTPLSFVMIDILRAAIVFWKTISCLGWDQDKQKFYFHFYTKDSHVYRPVLWMTSGEWQALEKFIL